ncbi:PhoX domain-containing protein [Hysterangium stoloniferum]|nr:PhoX domain-containing protein [Hysterangium stoloniferum]
MRQIGIQGAALVVMGAVALPVLARIMTSSLTLFLLSPFLVFLLGTFFLCIHILLGFILDLKHSPYAPDKSLRAAARPLAFSTPAAWQAVITRSQWSTQSPQSLPSLAPSYPVLSSSLNDILIMIVRDFVLVWYTKLSSSPSFPSAVSTTLHGSMTSLICRVSTLDLPSLIVHRVIPKVTAHVEQFRQSEVALRGAGLERHLTESEELDILLAGRYAGPGGKLHPAVENLASAVTKQTEEAHLRGLIDRALPFVLPPDAAGSKAVRIVIREIVTCAVLGPIMDMLSDPDFWNKSIDQLAGEAIRQQKLISKVRRILETQGPDSKVRSPDSRKVPRSENINLRTDPRRFESFLRSISRCDSLLDARRLKNDIVGEVRRTRTLLANHEKDDWINGEKTEDIVAYLDRLYTAKRKVENRIAVLGGVNDSSRHSVYRDSSPPASTTGSRFSLRDVLTNPSSLSYFMEFMDRRNRSLLVQFWLTVETFKNPLESVDSSGTDDEGLSLPPRNGKQSTANIKEDMTMLYDLYFSTASSVAALSVSQKLVDTIRAFILDSSPTSVSKERRVRKSVLRAQKEVEEELEQDFQGFERSDLWFRAVGDLDPRSSTRKNTLSQHIASASASVSQKDSESTVSTNSTRRASRTGGGESRRHLHGPYVDTAQPSPRLPPSKLDLLISPTAGDAHDARLPLFDESSEVQISSDLVQEEPSIEHMEAIQAALTDIIADDQRRSEGPHRRTPSSGTLSAGHPARDQFGVRLEQEARRGIFDEFDDEEERKAAAYNADEAEEKSASHVSLAQPGDLQLSYDIQRLGEKINKLQSQDAMLDTLIRKAELTGDAQELRLLHKSKSAMERELRELTFQKMQYEQQEADNRLTPDLTRVSISNSAVGEDDGKSVVRYLVEVQQMAMDGSFTSGWVVARRYSEFFNMHQSLKDKYLAVRNLEFPGKRLVTSLSNSFVDTRRISLEKYLQSLVAIPMVCDSEELRAFLSRQAPLNVLPIDTTGKSHASFPGQTIVRTVYRSVAESIDDMLFGPSMLEVMIQRLTRQAAEFAGIVGVGMNDEDLVAQAFKSSGKSLPEETLMKFPGVLKTLEGESSASSFSSPICDLILAVFELDKKNNWLRRQAIVIILQQVLGGTIERQLRDSVRSYLDEGHLLRYLNIFRDGLWPGGQLKPPSVPRTAEEKAHTRDEANKKLTALIPDLAANMIGRSNARRGARRIFAVLQNRRLNQHIVYTIVDEVSLI